MTVTTEHRNELARKRYEASKEEIARKRKEKRDADLEGARARQRASYYRNRDKKIAYQKEYAEKNKDRIKEWRSKAHAKRRDIHNAATRWNTIRRNYGITPEQWDALFELQGRKCAICGSENSGATNVRFHTDHCHKTKVVRGILCQPCNTGLGKFKDSPELLMKAIAYLQGAK
jgi:hypothetical protein